MLAFNPNFQHKPNFVLPLSVSNEGATLRVASLTSSGLGSVAVSGVEPSKLNLSLKLNPSWVTGVVNQTTSTITLSFTGAVPQIGFHEFFILAQDGVDQYLYPIALEVREPFFLLEDGSATTQGMFEIPSYDGSFGDIVVRGYGSNNQVVTEGVNILPPKAVAGLNFVTQDGSSLKLRVDQPDLDTDVAGGLKTYTTAPTTSQVLIKGYKSGTMYDTPERTFDKIFVVQSKSASEGQLVATLSSVWNDTAGYLSLVVKSDFLNGRPKNLRYAWSVAGVSGTNTSGGGSNDAFLNWTPTGTGDATIRVQVKDVDGNVLSTRLVTATVSSSGSWATTPSLKLLSSLGTVSAFQGEVASFTLSTVANEIGISDDVQVAFTLVGFDGTAPSIALSAPAPVTLTKASPSAVINLTLPTSPIKYKWVLQAHATIGAARVGRTQVVVESKGPLPLQLTGTATASHATGSVLSPITYTVSNFHGAAVTGATLELVGAPAGLYVTPAGAITGSVPSVGSYVFKVVASKTGYASGYKTITLSVTKGESRLVLGNLATASKTQDDNIAFKFTWSYSGTLRQVSLQKNMDPAVDVSTSTNCSSFISGASVFSLLGQDYVGTVYSLPVAVNSTSATQTKVLPTCPSVAVIDQNNQLTINWNPLAIQNAYSLYKGWTIQTKLNGGTAVTLGSPTGLEASDSSLSSRVFRSVLSSGSYAINMFPLSTDPSAIGDGEQWNPFVSFPSVASVSTFSLDKVSSSKGEAVTITLDPSYTGADTWRMVYGDKTASDWFPISVKNTAKAFNTAGSMFVTLELQKDYPDLNIKLRRSVTKAVYVLDQSYTPGESGSDLSLNSVGIGGEAGFEVTDASVNSTTEPYEVVVRALVKDELTQEVKLMVATSRTQDASSLLGTMAVDVFPLQGRPHLKDLVKVSAESLITQRSLPVKITTKTLPECVVGKPMKEVRLSASGGTNPFSWFSDNLPFGVRLSSDGTLNGVVLQAGTHAIHLSVKDSSNPCNIDQVTLYLVAKSDLAVTEATLADAQVGTKYSYQIGALGGIPPYTWSKVSGNVPVGMDITPEGILTGFPATYNSVDDFISPFVFTAEVTDTVGSKTTGQFSLNLTPSPLTLGNVDQSVVFEGQDFKLSLPVFGGQAPYTVSSFLSDGAVRDSLRVLYPDVLVAVAGQASIPLSVYTQDQSFTFSTTPGQGSQNLTFNLDATGGSAPYIWSLDHSDPAKTTLPGVTVQANGVVSGTLTVPIGTRATSLNYTVFVKVTDQNGSGRSATKVLKIAALLVPTVTDTNISLRAVRVDRAETYPYVGGGFNTTTLAITKLSKVSNVDVLPWAVPNKAFKDPESGSTQNVAIVLWDETGNQPLQDSLILNSWSMEAIGESIAEYKIHASGAKTDIIPGLSLMGLSSAPKKPLWYLGTDGATPMTSGLTPQGANVVVIKANVDLSSFGKTASEDITGVFCLSVAGPEAGTFAASGVPVGGALSLPIPVLTTKPNLEIRFTKNINSDGTETRTFTSASSPILSAIGGKPGYTFNVTGGTLGWSLTNYVTMGWNSTSFLDKVTPGFGTVTLQTQDANSNVYTQLTPCSVVQNIASRVSVDILTNSLPAFMEAGKSYTGRITTNTPCSFLLTNLTGFTIQGDGTTTATISGTVPSNASGVVNYSVKATSLIDTTKAATETFTTDFFAKSIVISISKDSVEAGIPYTQGANNSFIEVRFRGFTMTEFSGCTQQITGTSPLPSITANQPVLINDGSTAIPEVKVVYDFLASTSGLGVVNFWVGDANVSSADTVTVIAPQLSLVSRTDTIPVSEYDVDVTGAQVTVDAPLNISGGTTPYTLSVIGVSNPLFSTHTVIGDDIQFTFAQVLSAGQSYATNVTIQVQDATGLTSTGTGSINLTIASQNTITVNPITSTLSYTDGLSGVFEFKEGKSWTVAHGHAPYTFSVANVTVDSNISPFITLSPSKRTLRYNDSAFDVADNDLDEFGARTGSAWTTPKRSAHPVNGSYKISAVINVTDSKGIVGTVTAVVSVSVNIVASPVYYTVNATMGTGGTIAPAGQESAESGSSPVYTITPSTGYNLSAVLVDGTSVGAVTTYTFSNIAANHTITASFSKIDVGPTFYNIVASSGAGGTLTPVGTTQVPVSTNYKYIINPNSGYTISDVLVDGVSQGALTEYTFTNVTAAHTISAAFTSVTVGDPTVIAQVTGMWRISSLDVSVISGRIAFAPATNPSIKSTRVRYDLEDSSGTTIYSATLGLSTNFRLVGVSDTNPGEYTLNLTFEDLNASGTVVNTYSTFIMLTPDYYDITCPILSSRIQVGPNGETKAAGDLQVSDMVYAAHEISGVWGFYPVTFVAHHEASCCTVMIEDGTSLTASFTHPVLTSEGWVTLEDLNLGALVLPKMLRVTDILPAGTQTVVKLTIDDAHTFVSDGILSHNKVYDRDRFI